MKGSEIQNLVFSFGFFGYKKSDVKAFLREISEYVLKLESKVYKLEVERDKLQNKCNKTEIDERKFAELMNTAHDFKRRIENEAKKKAEEIINSAKITYEEVVKATKNEKLKLTVIKREVDMLRKTILEKLDSFVSMIEMKEKNMASQEEPKQFNFEVNISSNKDEKEDKFDLNKLVMNSRESMEKDEGETLEFNTDKNIYNCDDDLNPKKIDLDRLNPDKDYIKNKFREIDLR